MQNIGYLKTRFPNIKLSYEKILHTKVSADLYILEPEGEKAFIWFTHNNYAPICYMVNLNKYSNITSIQPISLCFNKKLSLGTIIYGTTFMHDNIKHFSCQDIYYFNGIDISFRNFSNKLEIFFDIFNNYISKHIYSNNYVLLSMPYMSIHSKDAFSKIKDNFYPVKSVIFISDKERKIEKLHIIKHKQIELVFKVYADIQHDIYKLYCKQNTHDVFVGYAYIPDYKTSIYMNSLFRKIVENNNLDLIEESESEEDFENIEPDKFINNKNGLPILCYYNKKFNKWIPKKHVPDQAITNKSNLQKLQIK